MMDTLTRKLPIGIQDFEDLRKKDFLYVDKTAYLYQLVTTGKSYFLGRPRRFGKSLFVSTLKAYFLGKKTLFEGLKIAETERDWITYPVIYIDFNRGSADCLQSVKSLLSALLNTYERQWGISDKDSDLSVRFSTLIETAYEKSGRQVVVLVDEYDRALVHTMDEPQLNAELRTFFKGFYGVLKGMDYCLRFVFLTGVTKFSKVSIFSDLNQLQDISLDNKFASICGISENELKACFEPELRDLADEIGKTYEATLVEMKKRYDGYRFAKKGEDMYNPFSVLSVFSRNDFGYFWFKTGTPTFLVKTLANNGYDISKFNNEVIIQATSIDDYRTGETSLVPLLYQSGYLTVKSYNEKYDEFTLGFPNEEVKYGFLNELLPAYVSIAELNDSFSASRFTRMIEKGDVDCFMNQLIAFLSSIPYDAIRKEHRDEQYYQHLFYLIFTLMGQFVETEVKSATGRADAVVKTVDSIYVFEFKMDNNATAEEALAQIDEKSYLIPYTADRRRLVKIGVEFSMKHKHIMRWLAEESIFK